MTEQNAEPNAAPRPSSTLTRLREDMVTPVLSRYLSDRIRNGIARLANRITART